MGYVWWKKYDIAKHTWKVIESWNFGLMLNDNLGEKIQNNIKWRQFFFFFWNGISRNISLQTQMTPLIFTLKF